MKRLLIVSVIVLFSLNTLYGYAEKTKMEFLPDSDRISVNQGETISISAKFKIAENYEINSIFPYANNLPDGIIVQFTPGDLSSTNMQNGLANVTINFYVNQQAKSGSYDLDIMALGYLQNINTGKLVPTQDRILHTIHLVIIENKKPISIEIGEPVYQYRDFCIDNIPNQTCQGKVFAEYPVTVFSKEPTTVKLEAFPKADGLWTNLAPDQIIASSNGTTAKLTTAGFVRFHKGFAPDKDVLVVIAESKENKAMAFLPVATTSEIAVLHGAEPLISYETVDAIINGTALTTLGVVYEPFDKSEDSISISLSFDGLVIGNRKEMPSWLRVEFPTPLITLRPFEPYYFPIKVVTTNGKEGLYDGMVNLIVEGKQFTKRMPINVSDHWLNSDWRLVYSNNTKAAFAQSFILGSPLQQINFGIEPEEIRCGDGLELILKLSNENPICVTQETKQILIERGWAKPV